MKIVCDSCGTKYSIADEKVRGKVFKIRCKKCSHIIVVRGGETGGPEATLEALNDRRVETLLLAPDFALQSFNVACAAFG